MDNKLTEKEKKYVQKLYKSNEKAYYNYIAIGFLGCISLLGIILGIKFHSKDGFLMAIYFGTLSIMLVIATQTKKTIVNIIKKLYKEKKKN